MFGYEKLNADLTDMIKFVVKMKHGHTYFSSKP
jgi:hypothetical protein